MKQLSLLAAASCLAACAAAQTLRPALNVKAIVGARIVVSPGKTIDQGTIVIRNGMIAEVGPSVQAPAGAEVLDGKGLTVYAGFIEGFTTKGVKAGDRPRQDIQPDITQDVVSQMRVGDPSIRADLVASSIYNPDDDVWKGYRSAGFTTALVSPPSGIFTGQASLINLDGRPRRFSTVAPSVALGVHLVGQGGTYPATGLGAYATARQAFLDAQRQQEIENGYRAGSTFRPDDDPALDALRKPLPLLIQADTMPQLDRCMDFAKEWRRPAMMVGASAGWKIADRLKSDSAFEILSLNFGAEPMPAKKPDDKTKPAPPGPDDPPVEKKQEDQRKWLEKVNNAELLDKAGVAFGLTSDGVPDLATFFKNLRLAIARGLSKDTALAALTVNPARAFGVEKILGTIEPGKVANLTILTGDFADENSKVKSIYIDGNKIDPARAPFKYNAPPQFGEGG